MSELDRGDVIEQAEVTATQAAEAEAAVVQADADLAELAEQQATDVAAEADAESDERAKKSVSIPKGRVDEMIKREQAAREVAERRAAELERQLAATDRGVEVAKLEENIIAMESEHAKALLDGDVAKAAELAGKIRTTERLIQTSANTQMSAQAKEQVREEIRLDMIIEQIELDFPQMDAKSEMYDQDAVDLVLASQTLYMNRDRMSPSAALALAAKNVMAKITPTAADDVDAKGLKVAAKLTERKEAQVDKNLKAAAAQPASMKDSGLDADKKGMTSDIDPTKLSYKDFDALPEATKSRLRGDTL
jgi:hypothetical protein